jgi:hypothetical protein
LGCAALSAWVAARIMFGSDPTTTCLALGLALPMLCVTALPTITTRRTAATACREMTGSIGSDLGAVRVQFGCFPTLCDFFAPLWVKLSVSELLTSR